MALVCDRATVRGKQRQIWCGLLDKPCGFVRFCAVSGKYYQTDRAKDCKARGKDERQN